MLFNTETGRIPGSSPNGYLRCLVREAFTDLKRGNIENFTNKIAQAGDRKFQWHRNIVDNEIDVQLRVVKATLKNGVVELKVGVIE